MQHDHVGQIYELLDEAAQVIAEGLQISYIEGLAEAGEMYFLEKADQLPLQEKQTGELNSLLAMSVEIKTKLFFLL